MSGIPLMTLIYTLIYTVLLSCPPLLLLCKYVSIPWLRWGLRFTAADAHGCGS